MSKRFLTPPNLPSGSSLPAAGIAGDLFFKSDEAKIYVHDGTEWVIAQGSGETGATSLVELSDTTITSPAEGNVLVYNSDTSKWINVQRSNYGNIDGGNSLSIHSGYDNVEGGTSDSVYGSLTELAIDGGSSQ